MCWLWKAAERVQVKADALALAEAPSTPSGSPATELDVIHSLELVSIPGANLILVDFWWKKYMKISRTGTRLSPLFCAVVALHRIAICIMKLHSQLHSCCESQIGVDTIVRNSTSAPRASMRGIVDTLCLRTNMQLNRIGSKFSTTPLLFIPIYPHPTHVTLIL